MILEDLSPFGNCNLEKYAELDEICKKHSSGKDIDWVYIRVAVINYAIIKRGKMQDCFYESNKENAEVIVAVLRELGCNAQISEFMGIRKIHEVT